MNLQSLVVIVLRLMALEFLLQSAVRAAVPVLSLVRSFSQSPGGWTSMIAPVQLIAALVGVAVLIWVFALPIARWVTRGASTELSLGALTLADCYSMAFLGVGLFYIADGLPKVLVWGHYLLKVSAGGTNAWQDNFNWYDVVQPVGILVVGLVLFMNGRRWALALARRDVGAGVPKEPGPKGAGGAGAGN